AARPANGTPGTSGCRTRIAGDARPTSGSYRVESRNRHVLRDVPEALVAPPDGTRTTVFAVLRSTESRRRFNNNGLPVSGQAHCCGTQGDPDGRAQACAYNRPIVLTVPERPLASSQELSAFLAEVERRAFKQAVFAVRDEDVALDVVQDAMLKLTENYAAKPAAELPMLFQRILQNTIHDHFRRQKVRSTWTTLLSALGQRDDKDEDFDPLETLPVRADSGELADPAEQHQQAEVVALIEQALTRLPPRQREAFLPRYEYELDVAEP